MKYYEYLFRIRRLLHEQCGINILENLEKFPVDLDPSLSGYHENIAERTEVAHELPEDHGTRGRYYVHRVRPFFRGGWVCCEVTFSISRTG